MTFLVCDHIMTTRKCFSQELVPRFASVKLGDASCTPSLSVWIWGRERQPGAVYEGRWHTALKVLLIWLL